jgi:hypothetical protein
VTRDKAAQIRTSVSPKEESLDSDIDHLGSPPVIQKSLQKKEDSLPGKYWQPSELPDI